jgi:hypothetical protein
MSAYTENNVNPSAPLLGLTIAAASTLAVTIDAGGSIIQFPASVTTGRFFIAAYWQLSQGTVDDEQFTTGYSTAPALVNCTAPAAFDALTPQQFLYSYVYASGALGAESTLSYFMYVDITAANATVELVGCQWGWQTLQSNIVITQVDSAMGDL